METQEINFFGRRKYIKSRWSGYTYEAMLDKVDFTSIKEYKDIPTSDIAVLKDLLLQFAFFTYKKSEDFVLDTIDDFINEKEVTSFPTMFFAIILRTDEFHFSSVKEKEQLISRLLRFVYEFMMIYKFFTAVLSCIDMSNACSNTRITRLNITDADILFSEPSGVKPTRNKEINKFETKYLRPILKGGLKVYIAHSNKMLIKIYQGLYELELEHVDNPISCDMEINFTRLNMFETAELGIIFDGAKNDEGTIFTPRQIINNVLKSFAFETMEKQEIYLESHQRKQIVAYFRTIYLLYKIALIFHHIGNIAKDPIASQLTEEIVKSSFKKMADESILSCKFYTKHLLAELPSIKNESQKTISNRTFKKIIFVLDLMSLKMKKKYLYESLPHYCSVVNKFEKIIIHKYDAKK